MGKKMTAYARKRLGKPGAHQFNGAESMTTIQRCRPYTDEPIPGSWIEGTQGAADKSRNRVNAAMGTPAAPPARKLATSTPGAAPRCALERSTQPRCHRAGSRPETP